jgi:hypothetical protein
MQRQHMLCPRGRKGWWLAAVAAIVLAAAAQAHPVPRRCYDRTIHVHLSAETVVVDFRLEVDPWTVTFVDLPAVADRVDLSRLKKPVEFYQTFTEAYAPLYADNLIADLDGQPLTFRCTQRRHFAPGEKVDEVVLDHLRCEFRFEAGWQPPPGVRHQFRFRDGTHELERGAVRLSLSAAGQVQLWKKIEPDQDLKERSALDLGPGDDEKLRTASAVFQLPAPRPVAPRPASPPPRPASPGGGTPLVAVAVMLSVAAAMAALTAHRRWRRAVDRTG